MQIYLKAMSRYADFSGRTSRADFMGFLKWHIILLFGTMLLMFLRMPFISILYMLGTTVPVLAIFARRAHDLGMPAVIGLIPLVNLLLLVKEGEAGPNAYGPDPLGGTPASAPPASPPASGLAAGLESLAAQIRSRLEPKAVASAPAPASPSPRVALPAAPAALRLSLAKPGQTDNVYRVAYAGTEAGPYTVEQLRHMATSGEVTSGSMLRAPSEARWMPALQVAGVSALFAATAVDGVPLEVADAGSGFAEAVGHAAGEFAGTAVDAVNLASSLSDAADTASAVSDAADTASSVADTVSTVSDVADTASSVADAGSKIGSLLSWFGG